MKQQDIYLNPIKHDTSLLLNNVQDAVAGIKSLATVMIDADLHNYPLETLVNYLGVIQQLADKAENHCEALTESTLISMKHAG
jgi:ligand-binding sensor protein